MQNLWTPLICRYCSWFGKRLLLLQTNWNVFLLPGGIFSECHLWHLDFLGQFYKEYARPELVWIGQHGRSCWVGFPKKASSLVSFSVIRCQRAADICTQMSFATSPWEQRAVLEIIFILWEIICWDHTWAQFVINSFLSEASMCWSIHHSQG